MLRVSVAKTVVRTRRTIMTAAQKGSSKREGNIADSFASLSGGNNTPLPDRFRKLKLELVGGREKQITESWNRLIRQLRVENDIIAEKGSDVIPQVEYKNLEKGIDGLKEEIKKRGVVVVRGVVPEDEARGYKFEIEEYVRKNPHTNAFPPHDPQVFELYWSAPQLKARGHPSLLDVQQHLMSCLWHTSSPSSEISTDHPLTYADRLRIRQPGDATFALGPHIDGGSVERWEKNGYGLGGVYDKIFDGKWEDYDPWDASTRVDAVNNLYNGLGACTMFRMWQGWLAMSNARPNEGTLLTNPLMKMATAYTLLRPFFRAKRGRGAEGYLDAENWEFMGEEMTSELQGATMGHGQELNDELHPHLELERTMVHVPEIRPGDFVAWHCDTIHAVDKIHNGTADSSVLYIPVCPITAQNAEYLVQQRDAFRNGTPGPDFPGGVGESEHVDRPTEGMLRGWTDKRGLSAMGLEKLETGKGGSGVVERVNGILGF